MDVYAVVTDSVIAALEAGVDKFEMPWTRATSFPINAATGKPYSGMNIFILWSVADIKGYNSPYWATYKQWASLGAQVKTGEKGTVGVYYDRFEKEEVNAAGVIETSTKVFMKAFFLFNASQVDGWEAPVTEVVEGSDTVESLDTFVRRTLANIEYGGARACYIPLLDKVQMPPKKAFKKTKTSTATEAFYATEFHELIHWTGASTRLDRLSKTGRENYAFEELVAELGAAMLCVELGVSNSFRKDHANYVGSWLKVLRDDKKAIFKAAKLSQEAVKYLKELQ